jgi:5-methyltetrahydrofolate--homocysteine methyltransferase
MDSREKEILFEEIVEGFVEFKPEKVKAAIQKGLDQGIDALAIQEDGLRRALDRLGELFEKNEVFLPHLMLGAKTFKEGSDILRPHLLKNQPRGELGTAVIGTVFGDLHDLGKNLVTLMWEVSGFKVIDLGMNVPIDTFIKAVRENGPKILGLSSLLTTTMLQQRNVIEALIEASLRDKVKILVGGAPVSERWAKEIGADGFAKDAGEAARVAKKFVGKG